MSKDSPIIPSVVDESSKKSVLNCHRFYAPVVVPEPDKLDPRRAVITPRLGNFSCIRENCMLWNKEKEECWDVSTAKAHEIMAEYAFARMNDVHIKDGGM